jgi:hypothetical protein
MYINGLVPRAWIAGANQEQLIFERNEKWLSGGGSYKSIGELHRELDKPLFMVGCMHLIGNSGILRTLLEQGYSIERLDNNLNPTEFNIDSLNDMEGRSPYNVYISGDKRDFMPEEMRVIGEL